MIEDYFAYFEGLAAKLTHKQVRISKLKAVIDEADVQFYDRFLETEYRIVKLFNSREKKNKVELAKNLSRSVGVIEMPAIV